MSSNYTGTSASFFSSLELMTGGDRPTAQLFRTPLERLLDNCTQLREREEALVLRQATTLRSKTATFTDTTNRIVATCLFGGENVHGPVLAIKAGEALAVYDQEGTEAYAGGAIPNLTVITDAAVNPDGRIVVVGGTSPYCAFKDPGGSWTGGGAQMGGTVVDVIYSPAYGGFLASRTTNVWRSTDATSWSSAATGLAGVQRIAAIGAEGADGNPLSNAGLVVALSTAAVPVFASSTDNGASFSATGGTVLFAAQADNAGLIAGCPMVTRNDLNRYVYHVGRFDSGARLRISRSYDGVQWPSCAVIEAPTGYVFEGTPVLRICQSTGLMVVISPATNDDGEDAKFLYTSLDSTRWLGAAAHEGDVASLAYAVAGGKLFYSAGDFLQASDGIGHTVHTT